VVRFQDKDRHQIFLEPEGRNTIEVYAQGMNTSLPEDVQEKMLHSMLGLEKVKILKAGYAVEYDFVYPEQLKHTLESTVVENLFFAGQINGSSGYEEAAAQGLMAGINAALKVRQLPGLVLQRNEAYIGTLIDDLINKKIAEPYRMMSSRAEYRLLLRQDNAVYRLAEKGYALGLISEAEIAGIRQKQVRIEEQIEVWKKQKVTPEQQQQYGLENKISMYELVKRPGYPLPNYAVNTANLDDFEVETEAAIVIKYEGYVQHQQDYLDHWERIQGKRIPANINYDEISGLKKESREKLKQHQPATIQDALKIAGINPADVSVLHMHLSRGGR
jgi:tRNA uridine 5-carboxymethylaminomethyl modification enzyme